MVDFGEIIWEIARALLTGAVGVFVGYKVAIRQHRAERAHDFCERQLREFYGPAMAALIDLDDTISGAFDHANTFVDEKGFGDVAWPACLEFSAFLRSSLWLALPSTRGEVKSLLTEFRKFDFEWSHIGMPPDDLMPRRCSTTRERPRRDGERTAGGRARAAPHADTDVAGAGSP